MENNPDENNNPVTEQDMQEMQEIFRELDEVESKLKNEWKEKLKNLVNVEALWKHLNEGDDEDCGLDSWTPVDVVEIKLTDEKSSGYASYQHARIIGADDKRLYMKQNIQSDNNKLGFDYYYIWQTVGMLGDDYSGFLLYPLNNGKFFKVSYTC